MLDPIVVEELSAVPVGPLEGMSTEIVTLCLDQIGRQTSRAVAVEVGEGARICRCRDSGVHGSRDDQAPRRLCRLQGIGKEGCLGKIVEVWTMPLDPSAFDGFWESETSAAAK